MHKLIICLPAVVDVGLGLKKKSVVGYTYMYNFCSCFSTAVIQILHQMLCFECLSPCMRSSVSLQCSLSSCALSLSAASAFLGLARQNIHPGINIKQVRSTKTELRSLLVLFVFTLKIIG